MDALTAIEQISIVADDMWKSDYLIDFNRPIYQREINDVESIRAKLRPRDTHSSGILISSPNLSASEYLRSVEIRNYVALFIDGSFAQVNYRFEGGELVYHRLLYQPCPYDLPLDLTQVEPILDVLEIYFESDDEIPIMRGPIRFDFDLHAQAENHPASHLTLVNDHCRWAVTAPLAPASFFKLIVSLFFPSGDSIQQVADGWPSTALGSTISDGEKQKLHIATGF